MNPKVVSFDQSAAYAAPSGDEEPPGQQPRGRAGADAPARWNARRRMMEYRLDLAGAVLSEMGCHAQSSRLLLDMLSRRERAGGVLLRAGAQPDGHERSGRRASVAAAVSPGGSATARARARPGGWPTEIEIYDTMNRPVEPKARPGHARGRPRLRAAARGRAGRGAPRACSSAVCPWPRSNTKCARCTH